MKLPQSGSTVVDMTMIYRPSAFRKLDHSDFKRRVKRIDPQFARMGTRAYEQDKTQPQVLGAALTGFVWAYLVAVIGANRGHIDVTLTQSALTPQGQYWIVSALTALLAASLVMLAAHLVRVVLASGARRKNSRALLIGAVAAFGLFHTPQVVWSAGFGLLDDHSQTLLSAADELIGQTLPGLDRINFAISGG
jgi:hypothetical protein